MAWKDTDSKLFDVVTVADVADEDLVGNSLLQISKLRFGQKANFFIRLWAQGLVKILKLKFRQIWSWSLVGILLLMFCRGYEVESWSRFWTRFWILKGWLPIAKLKKIYKDCLGLGVTWLKWLPHSMEQYGRLAPKSNKVNYQKLTLYFKKIHR